MAAPPEKTLKNMTGEWIVSSKLSTGFDEFLALQGIAWWKRQVSFVNNNTGPTRLNLTPFNLS